LFSVSDTGYKSYHWTFGDGYAMDKPSGLHDFHANFISTAIKLQVATKLGCAKEFDTMLMVKRLDIGDSLNIFPNPFNDHISIYAALKSNSDFTFMMYDAIGREVVAPIKWNRKPGVYLENFNFTPDRLSSGIYILYLKLNDKVIIKKMVLD